MKVICGYLKDNNELNTVASGGLLTAIARKVVSNGGCVFGVAYSNDFKSAHYLKVENFDDIELIKGTKYIRAEKKLPSGVDLNIEIAKCLELGKTVLCIGLPCDIVFTFNYLQKRKISMENYYAVDLVCHGPAFNDMHRSFVELLEARYKSHLLSYNVRYKNPDWKPAYIRAVFESGEIYTEKLNNSEFGKAFNVCPQPCSYVCKYKSNNRKSDITVGDYWGITEYDNNYNPKGVSVGFVHTEKYRWLLDDIEGFSLLEADENTALKGNPRYLFPLEKNPDSDRFRALYNSQGLEYACQNYMSIKTKIKKKIINILRR